MKLSAAASYFDNQSFRDAYSGVHVVYGQIDLYDDAQREGLTSVRRIVSIKPTGAIPARKAAILGSDVWLLSSLPSIDYFQASAIRTKYIAHRADGLAEIKTILQELSNTAGVSAYGATVWLKGSKEIDESSEVTNNVNLYFAAGESVPNLSVVKLRGIWYVVKFTYLTTTGFVAAVADQLDAPNFETVAYTNKVYNPVTDSYTGSPVNIKVLRIRWQDKFTYLSQASASYEAGDDVVMVRKADVVAPKTGDTLILSDGARRVVSFQSDGGLWHLQVRRA